ncbi:MAG: hypothetical protein V9E91_00285, partial [Burkholderiaceae bacterium]
KQIWNASKALGVIRKKGGVKDGWFWRLQPQFPRFQNRRFFRRFRRLQHFEQGILWNLRAFWNLRSQQNCKRLYDPTKPFCVKLWSAGIYLRLTNDGRNLSVPAGKLSQHQRALILANKPAIVEFLREVDAATTALIEATMHVCDLYGDNESKREAMRLDSLAVPPHLRLDLLEHFQAAYPQPSN